LSVEDARLDKMIDTVTPGLRLLRSKFIASWVSVVVTTNELMTVEADRYPVICLV